MSEAFRSSTEEFSSLHLTLSLTQVQGAKQAAEEAKDEAQMAYNAAFEAKNTSERARTDLEELLNEIARVIGTSRARPEDVEAVGSSVLSQYVLTSASWLRRLSF